MTVSIIGIGRTSVAEKWDTGLRELAWEAIEAALDDAGIDELDALYVGNMLSPIMDNQVQLGAIIADFAGLRGLEAVTISAGEASGAAALRQASLAVLSGQINTALVVGVEKGSEATGSEATRALAASLDAELEGVHGLTQASAAGLLMRRYMHTYGVELSDFAGFSVNAHTNGAENKLAMYRNRLKPERFATAPLVAEPVNLFDAAPVGDGAAAVIITRTPQAGDMVPQPIEIAGSASATDAIAIQERENPLHLAAAALSGRQALAQAGISIAEVDVAELHDSFTIMSTLALEALGVAAEGKGWEMAQESEIGRNGRFPISTFGGLKARGNPLGATGIYQIVELVHQLRGSAGANQVPDARIGLAQNLAGSGGTAVTHILKN